MTEDTWRLFLSFSGRIPRARFVSGLSALLLAFAALLSLLESMAGPGATVVLYPPFYWALLALCTKRAHDLGKSAAWFLWVGLPIVGFFWILGELLLRRGTRGENRFGPVPVYAGLDYLRVRPPRDALPNEIHEVTGLYPVQVAAITVPTSVEEVQAAVRRSTGPISVGGGRFSMGGQTASPESLHLDMRELKRVVWIRPDDRTARVQAGIRWCDLQRVLDPLDLSVKIMQTYANFTVGGSLGVNCHGRYMGLGPLILSVRRIALVLADGELVEASPEERPELFFGAIGGYGGLGVVVEVELELARNLRVERRCAKLATRDYLEHFRQTVRSRPEAVFHNADLYPPHYRSLRVATWSETDRYVTNPRRLMQVEPKHSLYAYILWAISETPFGPWRREYLFDPILFSGDKVHWRNFEAGYDVYELEPATRRWKTYVLQEYFVPIANFDAFVPQMAGVFQRYRVNVLNVSVRHAIADSGSYLAWAREEVFAFVVYYKQSVSPRARNEVAVWTRELIDAVISVGGTYYLPYQTHATPEQFHRAYPRARELFALKREVDPEGRFRNVIWDTYYFAEGADRTPALPPPRDGLPSSDAETEPVAGSEDLASSAEPSDVAGESPPAASLTRDALRGGSVRGLAEPPRADTGSESAVEWVVVDNGGVASEFHAIMSRTAWHDRLYHFLQNIYRLFPESRFHQLIKDACAHHAEDEAIYRYVQDGLPRIKPLLAELTYALPSLRVQKREIVRQTLGLLGARSVLNGYVEIGTTGRYASELRKHVELRGPLVLVHEVAPSNSPVDIVERGQLAKLGEYVPLANYTAIPTHSVRDASVDLVTCYIGLHHAPAEALDGFVRSIARVLRPGGLFVLRDHDVSTPQMSAFISLVHTVFNAGLGESWAFDRAELRRFSPLADIVRYVEARGFTDTGARVLQAHDPTDNTLLAFVKRAEEPA